MKKKRTGCAMTMYGGLAYAAGIEMAITVLACILLASGLNRKVIAIEKSGYMVMACLTGISFLGAATAAHKIKRRVLLTCIGSGILYWGILAGMSALLLHGRFETAGETGILILSGSLLAVGWWSIRNRRHGLK